ncbi:MFS transporter [Beijerinckia indica]|uniref:Major facilitator superfamily MFS_1 n=1 Tax=Beijerinckia indica subsp. indica (strain ATCC 9039 / DSM 1715 / NCIMB 8712) TaxID=395963 RepID=B2IF17_BEII9|nr:MFS transporter [Beijerinckia indica]ACB94208.1 major facilitator superfamily MFS_1 [Beijerinckia indica subsp. indica ATCC 9039]
MRDLIILFCTRSLRLFAFGLVSVILVFFLAERGFTTSEVGWLLSLTLIGDAVISLFLTTRADRWGRRRTLMVSGLLMVVAGLAVITTGNFWLLALAMTIGVISPAGNEVGPFLAVEQAALAHIVTPHQRTHYVAWYNVAGFSATALGALVGGILSGWWQGKGVPALSSYTYLFGVYAGVGLLLVILSMRLSDAVEVEHNPVKNRGLIANWTGLHESRSIVLRLSALFALDAFAGGFIVQSILAYWFYLKFGATNTELGGLFFATNILSGISALVAVPLARRLGLVNTMVFTHLPSNLLLMAVPLMPNFQLAVGLLLLRHLISQMDVPARQSYVMAVVAPSEYSAANGITATVRSLGSGLAPSLAGGLLSVAPLVNAPIFLAGGLKIVYDLALYRGFSHIKPPEEIDAKTGSRPR